MKKNQQYSKFSFFKLTRGLVVWLKIDFQIILCISFSSTDSGLFIYHLVIEWNRTIPSRLLFLPSRVESCNSFVLVCYIHLLSLQHNLFNNIVFCYYEKKNQFFSRVFTFVVMSSYAISLVCCLKYPYSCSSNFCFLIFVVFLIGLMFLLATGWCNKSLFSLFCIFLVSFYWSIYTILNAGESSFSFFPWHI